MLNISLLCRIFYSSLTINSYIGVVSHFHNISSSTIQFLTTFLLTFKTIYSFEGKVYLTFQYYDALDALGLATNDSRKIYIIFR